MWVESVPNFSEGRREKVLQEIAQAASIPGVKVLGMEGDYDHNRAVMTLVGEGHHVITALFRAAAVAVREIDLRAHRGVHPRIGAVDVIPIIPLGATTMAQAVQLSRDLGEQLGRELGLPVYLYEHSASQAGHHNLADVRRGEFEGLAARIGQDPPDFGPHCPHRSAGAVALGARGPLIAFNILLSTDDMAVAKNVAKAVRGSSGGMRGVKALPMDTASRGRVQVSLNFVDYPQSSLPRTVEMVRREAARYGVAVVSTELIGLMPIGALLETAQYYLQQPGLSLHQMLEWELLSALPHSDFPEIAGGKNSKSGDAE